MTNISKRRKIIYAAIGVGLLVGIIVAGYLFPSSLLLPAYRNLYKSTTQAAFDTANAELDSPLSYVGIDARKDKKAYCFYTAPPRSFDKRLGCFAHLAGQKPLSSEPDKIEEFSKWIDDLHRRLQENQWTASKPETPRGGNWHPAHNDVIFDLKSANGWVKYTKKVRGNTCVLSIQTYKFSSLEDGAPDSPRIVNPGLSCDRSARLFSG